jgi:hypothetical protein
LYLFKGSAGGSENPLFLVLLGLGAGFYSRALYLSLLALLSLIFWCPLLTAYLALPGASWKSVLPYIALALNSVIWVWAARAMLRRRWKRKAGAAA